MAGEAGALAVSIIGGTGGFGHGLALRWAAAGVPLAIGSRDASRAADAATAIQVRLGGRASVVGYENTIAAAAAPIVVLSVPLVGHVQMLRTLRPALRREAILVDTTAPLAAALGGRPTQVLQLWAGSAAEEARALLPPTVHVLSAFHTLSEQVLENLDQPLDEDVFVCGDDATAKRALGELISLLPGARAVDAGPLEMARLVEPLAALLISINRRYRAHTGLRVTGLPQGEERADGQ